MPSTKTKEVSNRHSIQNEWMVKSAHFVLSQVHPSFHSTFSYLHLHFSFILLLLFFTPLPKVQPKVLWGESAPWLFLSLGASIVVRLRGLAQKFNYTFSIVKTDTALHGLPQQRQRTFYFFWRSNTAPLMSWLRQPCPNLLQFLQAIPSSAPYQDIFVHEGTITERFKPYQFILLRTGLDHDQFNAKMAKENNGTITMFQYLNKNNLLKDCISWMKLYFPQERWKTNIRKRGINIVDHLEQYQKMVNMNRSCWDDSPFFMNNTFTAVTIKNVVSAVHPSQNRFINIREIMHLMGLPHDYIMENVQEHWSHVCENVPVNTAAAWAEQVVNFCRGELQLTQHQFLKQDNLMQKMVSMEGTINVKHVNIMQKEKIKIKQEDNMMNMFEVFEMDL